uniref:Conotoxin n=1 Tax=Conus betulinus TaxID=89764 RepID=A0A142C1J6_CONBE|nr:conotoxin [Conus betulinus]
MNFSLIFILALVLTLSMSDGFIRRAENGERTFSQHSPDAKDVQTHQINTRNLCPHCPNGCHMDRTCI